MVSGMATTDEGLKLIILYNDANFLTSKAPEEIASEKMAI